VKNVQIDGLFLDGIGYDRQIMKRLRKALDRNRPGCLLDYHMSDSFEYLDMQNSSASMFMEHFPYLDSLWFGELFDYNKSPDYWLVEISGIPFGLFGEMLQGGGNPWRGMIYGMTNRLGWGGDARNVWKVWDDFGIQDAKMIGYWDRACPVETDHKEVLATAYVKKGKTLISLASWAKEPVRCRLQIDWKALRLDPQKSILEAPELSPRRDRLFSDYGSVVEFTQEKAVFEPSAEIPVQPGRGWLLILEERA
jgi:hypothetical protein